MAPAGVPAPPPPLVLEQHFLGCLSQASYLLGDQSSGRALVVDPQRDVSAYLAGAARLGLRIERVVETHFHADFVSGHLELAAATGAAISYGEPAEADFPIELLRDGQVLSLGQVEVEVRATPGHTPESISLVVRPGSNAPPYAVLTGDTLFIGDVGRPDLLSSTGVTAAELAGRLYRSLHQRLAPLPDATLVYPGHGAGSACGKALSSETVSTMGRQRATNYALAPMAEEDFVALVTEGQPTTPAYFSFDAHRNREAHPLLDEQARPPAFGLDDVLARQQGGAKVLDTRSPADFATGHLRGSLNVGLEGRFAEYAGDVLAPEDEVVLVGEPGSELEARVRLARIGFDRVTGHLVDAVATMAAHPDVVEPSSRLTAAQLHDRLAGELPPVVVDVRNPGEVAAGAIPGALRVPLARLLEQLHDVDRGRPAVVYCAGGYRSSIAASALRAAGHPDVSDLLGGYEAWARQDRDSSLT